MGYGAKGRLGCLPGERPAILANFHHSPHLEKLISKKSPTISCNHQMTHWLWFSELKNWINIGKTKKGRKGILGCNVDETLLKIRRVIIFLIC